MGDIGRVCLCVNSGRKAHMLGTVMTWSERYQMAGDKGVNVSVAGRIEGGDIAQGRGGKFGRPGRPSRKLTRHPHPPPSNVNQEYDVFHLFWDALQKREEKKKKLSGQNALINGLLVHFFCERDKIGCARAKYQ
jgi:hypothetical protein